MRIGRLIGIFSIVFNDFLTRSTSGASFLITSDPRHVDAEALPPT